MTVLMSIFLPLAAAPFVFAIGKRSSVVRDVLTVGVACIVSVLSLVSAIGETTAFLDGFAGCGIAFSIKGFRAVLYVLCALVFTLSALASHAYFGNEKHTPRYQAFFLVTFGSLLGVFASNNLFSTYVFFEMMSLASWVWVATDETDEARRAADTYLAVAIIGGLVLLYGVSELAALYGAFSYDDIGRYAGLALGNSRALIAGFCLLFGFGAKAGMFPLHIWLPKAHPVAPAPASALLSGILTKAGIFGVLLLSAGVFHGVLPFALAVLISGAITMVLGAVLALLSTNLKRLLACSSLSQIGFILIACACLGMGEETFHAASGALMHAVNHALTKMTLFLIAGAVYKQNHSLDLNDLRGAGRGNLTLLLCFAVAGLSLAGFPGLSGYLSKTLIHEAILDNTLSFGVGRSGLVSSIEKLFLLSGGMTLAYMLKVFFRLFIERSDKIPVRLDAGTTAAITLPAVVLVLFGTFSTRTVVPLTAFMAGSLNAHFESVRFFVPENLTGALISLLLGVAIYCIVVRRVLTNTEMRYRDVPLRFTLEDNVYRPLLHLFSLIGALAARLVYRLTDWFVTVLGKLLTLGKKERWTPKEDEHFARYSKAYVPFGRVRQTLAFELVLFGLGVVVMLAGLLLTAWVRR